MAQKHMLGKDYIRIEVDFEWNNERLKSFVFFYEPLLGKDAFYFYESIVLKGSVYAYQECSNLLEEYNISIDTFEEICGILNEYHLLRTFNKEDKYILKLIAPLQLKSALEDGILSRAFILKTSGKRYQELLSMVSEHNENYDDFVDISVQKTIDISSWNNENETYLKKAKEDHYTFDTFFNINEFLKDISINLLPMRFRTKENLYALANLADLYNIDYDTMRRFLPKVFNIQTNLFDKKLLEYYCRKSKCDYQKVKEDEYDVPCKLYLMSLQDGKEVSDFDCKILYKLSNDYHLRPCVINVLLAHCLHNCDNRLIEKYIYAIASDLHRNNVLTSKDALDRLDKFNGKKIEKENLPKYDSISNATMSSEEMEQLLSLRKKK